MAIRCSLRRWDVTGEWRGEMVGRILQQGNTQHNNIALSLEQVGDQVRGTFTFLDGPTLVAPGGWGGLRAQVHLQGRDDCGR